MVRDWANLEGAVLVIAQKLSTNEDYVHLRAVCKGWRRHVPLITRHLPRQAPWLLLPRSAQYVNGERFADDSVLSFYDPYMLKTHSWYGLPQCHRATYIHGSSYGWLVLEYEHRMWFYNPINRSEIGGLPLLGNPLFINNFSYVWKVVLSCNPSIQGCVVVVSGKESLAFLSVRSIMIGDPQLCFCRIGDPQWTVLKMKSDGPDLSNFTFHNNLVYMLNQSHRITVYDLKNPAVPISTFSLAPVPGVCWTLILVEGSTEYGGIYRVRQNYVFKRKNDFGGWEIITNRAIYLCFEQCFDLQLEEGQGSRMNLGSLQENSILINWMNLENINHDYTTSLPVSGPTIGQPSWFTPSLM